MKNPKNKQTMLFNLDQEADSSITLSSAREKTLQELSSNLTQLLNETTSFGNGQFRSAAAENRQAPSAWDWKAQTRLDWLVVRKLVRRWSGWFTKTNPKKYASTFAIGLRAM